MTRLLAALFALGLAAPASAQLDAWPSKGGGGSSVVLGVNVAQDVDGDLLPDLIYCADFDNDGALEMSDVLLCVRELTDTGDKTVVVLPGSYAPPADPEVDYPEAGDTAEVSFGLIELDSNTTLTCVTPRSCTLVNSAIGDSGQDYAVVSNLDHTTGNSDIVIEGLEIDGAEGDVNYSGTSLAVTQRMGVYLRKTTATRIENNFVHDTHHACVYTSNSTNDTIINNRLDDCGGVNQTTGTTIAQPGVYAFATGTNATTGARVIGNRISNTKGGGFQTRANDTTDSIVDIEVRGNFFSDCVAGSNYAITIRGVDGASILENSGVRCGGILTHLNPAAYYSAGDRDASRRLSIIGNTFREGNNTVAGAGGIAIGSYLEDVTLSGNVVDGTAVSTDCFVIRGPHRRLVIDGLSLRRCGGDGFQETSGSLGSRAGEEGWLFRNITIDGVDDAAPVGNSGRFYGMQFIVDQENLTLDGFNFRGATDPELSFAERCVGCMIRNGFIDSTEPKYLGTFTEAQAAALTPIEDTWIVVSDASGSTDCTFASGTGATANRCAYDGGAWVDWTLTTRWAIEFDEDTGANHSDVTLRNITVKNVQASVGIRLFDGADYTLDNIECIDDSTATTTPGTSCIQFVSNGAGAGEFSGIRLSNVRNDGFSVADSITIDEDADANDPGEDDLFTTEFSFINHRGTSAATTAPFAAGVCTGANGSLWVDTDDTDDGTYYCENGTFTAVATP